MKAVQSHLEQDSNQMEELLAEAKDLSLDFYRQRNEWSPGKWIADLPKATLPEKGIGARASLAHFRENYYSLLCNSAGPRYFGFVTGGSTPAAMAGDWLVSAFDQNACGSNDTVAPQLERQTIQMLCQLFGMTGDWYGSFVTGATQSNLVSLAIGREWVGKMLGKEISIDGLASVGTIKVLSGTPHSSIFKSLSILGMGRASVELIPTLPDREAIDLSKLEAALQRREQPVIVVANAGTVNTVDFDDIEAIGKLKDKYRFWLHVDAAFGGFAACSPTFANHMKGINHADSVTVDAHKWLNVPYDAAMQFTRHKELQGKVFRNQAAYLSAGLTDDYFHYTPENSRRFRALPSWFALTAYGREGCKDIVERNCAMASEFGKRIQKSSNFTLLSPVRMNVVCFTLQHEPNSMDIIQLFLKQVRDDGKAFFTPTQYNGKAAIRAAFSNWQTKLEDVEIAVESLERCARKILSKQEVQL